MIEKLYGLVVFGTASFVGKLLCRYLVDEFGFNGRLRWAAADRFAAGRGVFAAAT